MKKHIKSIAAIEIIEYGYKLTTNYCLVSTPTGIGKRPTDSNTPLVTASANTKYAAKGRFYIIFHCKITVFVNSKEILNK